MSVKFKILLFFLIAPVLGLLIQFMLFSSYIEKDFNGYIFDFGLKQAEQISSLIDGKSREILDAVHEAGGNPEAYKEISGYLGTGSVSEILNLPIFKNGMKPKAIQRVFTALTGREILPFFTDNQLAFIVRQGERESLRYHVFSDLAINGLIKKMGPMDLGIADRAGLYSFSRTIPTSAEVFESDRLLSSMSKNPIPSAFEFKATNNGRENILAQSLVAGTPYLIVSAIDATGHQFFNNTHYFRLLLVFVGLGLFLTGVSFYLSQSFIEPVDRIVDAMDKVSTGKYDFTIPYTSQNEFGRLAKRFNQMLDNIRSSLRKQEELSKIKSELETANIVQRLFNNAQNTQYNDISIAGMMLTASECGGDYWTHFENHGRIFIVLGDATGHGTPAALVTAAASSAVNSFQNFPIKDTGTLLHELNQVLYKTVKGEIYMTMLVLMIDPAKRMIEVGCAGHVPLYYAKDMNEVERWSDFGVLAQKGSPVGRDKDLIVDIDSIPYGDNSRFMLCTDGFFDVADETGKKMNDRGLVQLFLEAIKKTKTNADSVRFVKSSMMNKLHGRPPPDDLTLITISMGAAMNSDDGEAV